MKIEASAPSNIALIKYMGKSLASSNLPSNASLSYSVDHLRSFVTIENDESGSRDNWSPLEGTSPVLAPLELSTSGREKFLSHFERLKQHFDISGSFHIRSANNFPSDCGMASSASSFAALTVATARLASKIHGSALPSAEELSRLSRLGSGSSCRSLFSPWALWRGEGAESIQLHLKLEHAAIVLESKKKAVTSSEAHIKVVSSALFEGRALRAERRLQSLLSAIESASWREIYEICWAEFWDMHALFETSHPHFGYMTEESMRVLNHFRAIWNETGDGPVVTMDAGANVHIFCRSDQTAKADEWLNGMQTLKSWGAHSAHSL